MKSVVAWHFMKSGPDGKPILRNGRECPAKGVMLKHDGEVSMCNSGLHASVRAIDALSFAPGSWVARVCLSGTIVESPNKCVASQRTIIEEPFDATRLLHEFACDVAEDACLNAGILDIRPYAAIKAKRDWLDKKISDEQLAAASDAAWAAARAAASDEASAAASDAASAAASDAASARAAASAAVRAAAWAEAWAAAGAEAWAAARDAQNKVLEKMLRKAMKKGRRK